MKSKKFSVLFLLFLFASIQINAEGTRELRATNGTDYTRLILNRGGSGGGGVSGSGFALLNCNSDRRLYIRIKDHTIENIYLGFKASSAKNYRIVSPSGIVGSWITLPTSGSAAGAINTLANAVAGPSQLSASGYTANTYNPSENGDFYIEFDVGTLTTSSNQNILIEFFDITVISGSSGSYVEKKGRLYSKSWDFANYISSSYIVHDSPLYIYTIDGYVFKSYFKNMKPGFWNMIANNSGPGNTGNVVSDRKSTTSGPTGSPMHFIFINDPDVSVFSYGVSASLSHTPSLDCSGSGGSDVIDVEPNISGVAAITLTFPSPYTLRTLTSNVTGNISNPISWDGLDGSGTIVPSGTIVTVGVVVTAGLVHFPLFDIEGLDGLAAELIHPGTAQARPLFWDDSNISGGTSQTTSGCSTNTSSPNCHGWSFSSSSAFGNNYTINTWFNGYQLNSSFSFTKGSPPPVINSQPAANVSVCENNAVNLVVGPNPTPAVTGYQWQFSKDNGTTWTNISGATNDTYTFNPSISDDNTLYQVMISSNGCSVFSTSSDLNVNSLPSVNLDPFSNVFVTSSAFTLTGGSPTGGVYSGDGINAGLFTPSIAGSGIHTINYIYTDVNGCQAQAAQNIEVINNLPIELIEFSTACNTYNNLITWSTASEKNNDFFELLISNDLENWRTIAKIQGQGTKNQISHYNFQDSIRYNTNYYRLKQVDFDGEEKLFAPISSMCDANSKAVIIPNPNHGNFTLQFTTDQNGETSILLSDLNGQVLYESIIQYTIGTHNFDFNHLNLKQGIYLLKYQLNGKTENLRFTVN